MNSKDCCLALDGVCCCDLEPDEDEGVAGTGEDGFTDTDDTVVRSVDDDFEQEVGNNES